MIEGSSREIKQDIAPVDSGELLSRLEELEVVEWSYERAPEKPPIGPMAEDFYETFGFGQNAETIFPRDLAGIALAAAMEVHQRNRALAVQNAELQARSEDLQAQNADLLERLERIEARLELGPAR